MLERHDTGVDAMELAIAMYIVISLIVHGPDIEKAAVTIRETIRDACSRIETGDKVYCFENAKCCTMDSEPGDHLYGDPIPRNAIYEALHVRPS
jgi:hypothetical protein